MKEIWLYLKLVFITVEEISIKKSFYAGADRAKLAFLLNSYKFLIVFEYL